jgi:quercetin dioxygenase-like cupin family protein
MELYNNKMNKQTCTVLTPGQGIQYWCVGEHLTFKVGAKETGGAYALAETIIEAGGGPPPHVHHREHEIFYVLRGRYRLGFDTMVIERGPGSALFLPKGIAHVFKNVGDEPGQCLVFAAPGGFEAMIKESGEVVDGFQVGRKVGPADVEKLLAAVGKYGLEVRPDWRFNHAGPPAAAGKKFWALGHLIEIKLTSAQTQGVASVIEISSDPGATVPPHAHREMDEIFYVLEGRYEFDLPTGVVGATPGTFIHVPKGTVHSFRAVGETRAKLVDFHMPGGFERFIEDVGVPATDEETAPEMSEPDPKEFQVLMDIHGMDMPQLV